MERRPSTVHAALDEWFDDLTFSKSPRTVDTYRTLLRFPDMPLDELTRAWCRSWLAGEIRRRKPAGANACRDALSSFGKWLVLRGYALNPAEGLGRVKVPQAPPKALSPAQVTAIENACRDDNDRLLLALLGGAGLRRAEVAGLRWADFDVAAGTMRILGKGSKVRIVLIPRSAEPYIGDGKGSVFAVGPEAIYQRFKKIARRGGIGWAHPHQLRHSYATRMLAAGMSPLALQTLGGWADDAMVKRYARAALTDAALNEARRIGQP